MPSPNTAAGSTRGTQYIFNIPQFFLFSWTKPFNSIFLSLNWVAKEVFAVFQHSINPEAYFTRFCISLYYSITVCFYLVQSIQEEHQLRFSDWVTFSQHFKIEGNSTKYGFNYCLFWQKETVKKNLEPAWIILSLLLPS